MDALTTIAELAPEPVPAKIPTPARTAALPCTFAQMRLNGVEFRSLPPSDRLILGSLVWYQMYEHPQSVA